MRLRKQSLSGGVRLPHRQYTRARELFSAYTQYTHSIYRLSVHAHSQKQTAALILEKKGPLIGIKVGAVLYLPTLRTKMDGMYENIHGVHLFLSVYGSLW